MNEIGLIIVGIAALALIAGIALRRWVKANAWRKASDTARDIFPMWAQQGPFENGTESAAAMRYAWLAVSGDPARVQSMSKQFAQHRDAFDADPNGWEDMRQTALQAARPDVERHVNEALRLKAADLNPSASVGGAPDVPSITPVTAALIPVRRFLESRSPFAEEETEADEDSRDLPGEYEDYVSSLELAYKFVTYLKLLQVRFGEEIAQIVRANIGIALGRVSKLGGEGSEQPTLLFKLICDLDQVTDTAVRVHSDAVAKGVSFPVGEKTLSFADVPLDYAVAQLALETLPQSPLVREQGRPSGASDATRRELPERTEMGTMMRLAEARDRATDAFSSLVDVLSFEPSSIDGLR